MHHEKLLKIFENDEEARASMYTDSFPSFRSSRHCFILVCKLGDFSNIAMKFVSIFICIKVIVFQEFHYQLNVHFKNLDLHFPI